jgi:UDP-N-acetylglucosamine--N-acetylmuramyl-(pentapeptide) pyrophosphoryl-undecaprenol N-acetylglucosamine transferase
LELSGLVFGVGFSNWFLKFVITGGHHNSALAVVDELNKHGKHQYLWFGHRHSVWGDKADSAECKEIAERNIPFVDLKAGKLYRTFSPAKLVRLPRGLLNASWHLAKFRPDLILSFGGYLAAPTAIAGAVLKIPIHTHEQTSVAGWSNRLIAKLAQKIFITWPESAKYFPKNKVIITGLPIRKELLATISPRLWRGRRQPPPLAGRATIYITGGKQGSHTINKIVKEALPQLLKSYNIIHQCGSVSFLNSKKDLEEAASKLPPKLKNNYLVEEYYPSEILADILQKADFIIGRGGAHTIYELAFLAKPSIIIPIPWVSHGEQLENAKILKKAGSSIIINENNFTTQNLIKACQTMKKELKHRKSKAQEFSKTIKSDAASKIAREILSV